VAVHHLALPVTADDIDKLAAGDIVYLSGDITVTGGLPAHKRIIEYLDAGKPLPVPVTGTFMHLPHMVEPKADGSGYDIHYVNPTTSMRFDAFMPRLVKELGLRIVGGKGGLGPATAAAMQEAGCVYVSLLGGGSPILSAAIREVLQVEWHDFPSHFRLSRLRIEAFGPLTVGIDAHGNSLYADLAAQALDRIPAIMARLDERRRTATHGE